MPQPLDLRALTPKAAAGQTPRLHSAILDLRPDYMQRGAFGILAEAASGGTVVVSDPSLLAEQLAGDGEDGYLLCTGDSIVEVNGMRQPAAKLLQTLEETVSKGG